MVEALLGLTNQTTYSMYTVLLYMLFVSLHFYPKSNWVPGVMAAAQESFLFIFTKQMSLSSSVISFLLGSK